MSPTSVSIKCENKSHAPHEFYVIVAVSTHAAMRAYMA